jgi:hypothetical protein
MICPLVSSSIRALYSANAQTTLNSSRLSSTIQRRRMLYRVKCIHSSVNWSRKRTKMTKSRSYSFMGEKISSQLELISSLLFKTLGDHKKKKTHSKRILMGVVWMYPLSSAIRSLRAQNQWFALLEERQ